MILFGYEITISKVVYSKECPRHPNPPPPPPPKADNRNNYELYEALQLLHDDVADYQRINKLGGYDNHCMRLARAALQRNRPQPIRPAPPTEPDPYDIGKRAL